METADNSEHEPIQLEFAVAEKSAMPPDDLGEVTDRIAPLQADPSVNLKSVARLARLAKDFNGSVNELPPEKRQKYIDMRREARARRLSHNISNIRGRF